MVRGRGFSVQLSVRYGVSTGAVWDRLRPVVSAVRGRAGDDEGQEGGASPAEAGIFEKRETSVGESSLSWNGFAASECRPSDRKGAFCNRS